MKVRLIIIAFFSLIKKLVVRIIHYISRISSQLIKWLSQKKPSIHNIFSTLPIVIIAYLISVSFLTDSTWMRIIGITLQVLAGVSLALSQIHNKPMIKDFIKKIIEKPQLFAFLITLIIYAIFLVLVLPDDDLSTNIWQSAFGILALVSLSFYGFIFSISVINKVYQKWHRKEEILISGEKVSFSLKYVSAVFSITLVLIVVLFIILASGFFDSNEHRLILLALMLIYGYLVIPPHVISIIFIATYLSAKAFGYIWKDEKRVTTFWIFIFVIWTWGGLLLIINEIKA